MVASLVSGSMKMEGDGDGAALARQRRRRLTGFGPPPEARRGDRPGRPRCPGFLVSLEDPLPVGSSTGNISCPPAVLREP